MTDRLLDTPKVLLHGMDELKQFLVDNPKESLTHDIIWEIESDFLEECIQEVIDLGKYPYNATVYELARAKMGLDYIPYYGEGESDLLSTLAYNAHRYRRSNNLKAAGFVTLTQNMLDSAFELHKNIELEGGKTYKVVKINNQVYAKVPHKHMKALPPQQLYNYLARMTGGN